MLKKNRAFVAAVCAVLTATAIICVSAVSCSSIKIEFCVDYYFVCYRVTDNSVSASSLSGTVASYGGAGYILHYDGNYYVTVACYYSDNDAQTVRASLERRDLTCSVLEVSIEEFRAGGSAKRYADLYKGNLNTLNSLSIIAYECANGLDGGDYTQSKAKDVIAAIGSGLNGLYKNNPDNCFTDNLRYLIAECDDKSDGYVYSKDLRYLQIAITDAIINCELY